jgi:hypothetical protein
VKPQGTTILDACRDPQLFGRWFRRPETWGAWFGFLAVLFNLPTTEPQRLLYRQCSGRRDLPTGQITEAWLCCGRRAGKSFVLSLIAVYLACFRSYAEHLGPGERCTVVIAATDRRQARVIFRYIRGLILGTPLLAPKVERETADAIDLDNGVSIEVQTTSTASVRGYTVCAALCDELAYWPGDGSAEPDREVIASLRPAMATIPGAMLLCASSPRAKRGALWEAYDRHYGKDDPGVLVWRSPTTTMNPTVPQSTIDAALAHDRADALAEYYAEFRNDLESFISREGVMACVDVGVRQHPPRPGIKYESFTDPSGGSSDSMTCAVGHVEGDIVVVDCVREIMAPFDPDSAVDELVQLLGLYGVRATNGDRYAAAWCSTAFEKRGVAYRHSELPRSALYLNLLPHLNSLTVRLLDDERAVGQIASLERRTARGARDTVDHPKGQHDDIANAIAGLVFVTAQRPKAREPMFGCYGGQLRTMAEINALGRSRLKDEAQHWSAPCTLIFPPEPVEPLDGGFRASRMDMR